MPFPAFQRPEVQLRTNVDRQVVLGGSAQTIAGFTLPRISILLQGTSTTARNNFVGMRADGGSEPGSGMGIVFAGAGASTTTRSRSRMPSRPHTSTEVRDAAGPDSGPVVFLDGATSSALAYTYAGLNSTSDDLQFFSDGGTTWGYQPVPNTGGCDPAVTHIRVHPRGAMAGSAGAAPWFEIRFRVRVN